MERPLSDWVFGYGSLIWNPEFEFRHSELGRVHGYHRAFCIRSTYYRGTTEQPGMVLGLVRGGSCVGVAFHLQHEGRRQALERLYEREMLDNVYIPTLAAVTLTSGRQIRALTFVANRGNEAYERLTEPDILARLARARGERGTNRDYAINTHQSLQVRGVHDPRLARLVYQLRAGQPAPR